MASLPASPTDSMSRPAPFTVLQPVTRTLANKARRIARKLVIFCNLSGVVQNGPARFEGGEGMRAGPMFLSSAAGGQTGRASCWERGCQYVWVSVVAVYF